MDAIKACIEKLDEKQEDALNFIAIVEAVDQSDEVSIKSLIERIDCMKDNFVDHLDAAKLLLQKTKSYMNSV